MTDRPILFSGPMVRALLDGRKTQTRRVLKPQPATFETAQGNECLVYPFRVEGDDHWRIAMGSSDRSGVLMAQKMPYGPGDRLWVREAWHGARSLDSTPPRDIPRDADIEHAATARGYAEIGLKGKLRPGMFLPRWASRLTLIVTDVRVQRLQQITLGDICLEGLAQSIYDFKPVQSGFDAWMQLWDSLNADRGFGWDANPWVAAVSFTVDRRNIDEVPA